MQAGVKYILALPNITSLSLRNSLDMFEGVWGFLQIFEDNTTLTYLDRAHNYLYSGLQSFENNTTLTHLDLAQNSIDCLSGLKYLANLVENNSSLNYLNISQNNIWEGDLLRLRHLKNSRLELTLLDDDQIILPGVLESEENSVVIKRKLLRMFRKWTFRSSGPN